MWRHLALDAGGHTGLGEFTIDPASPQLDDEAEAVARSLVGRAPDAALADEFAALRQRDLGGAAIVSAIDQAVHDVRARTAGQALAAHLGAVDLDRPISLYANVNRRTVNRSPAGFGASASRALAQGFSAIKIAPFDGVRPELCGTREGDRLVGQGLERIATVRDSLPKSVTILVDCHWRLTQATSIDILPELSALGVSWFECPLPEEASTAQDIATVRRRANRLGVRLAGCETMTLWEGFRPFVEAGAYDVIMPDVKYVGGFSALRQVVEQAGRQNVAVSLHNPTGPVCHLHSLHACVALGLTERLEMQFEESPLFDTLIHPSPPKTTGGVTRLPPGSGLGSALRDSPAGHPEEEMAAGGC